jgi:hypothetical protein
MKFRFIDHINFDKLDNLLTYGKDWALLYNRCNKIITYYYSSDWYNDIEQGEWVSYQWCNSLSDIPSNMNMFKNRFKQALKRYGYYNKHIILSEQQIYKSKYYEYHDNEKIMYGYNNEVRSEYDVLRKIIN